MASVATASRPVSRRLPSGLGRSLLSGLFGAGFTLLLFSALARFERDAPNAQPAEIADLRAVAISEPPPPPPEARPQPVPELQSLVGLENLASESPVRLAVTPPDIASLLPPPSVPPPAVIRVGEIYPTLRPKMDEIGIQDRIYQMAEVDEIPRAINRVTPTIPSYVRRNAKQLRASLFLMVDANGEIKNVRLAGTSGNPQFDEIIMENIKEWTFSPAVRRGRKVRCLLQQAITIKWTNGSPFTL